MKIIILALLLSGFLCAYSQETREVVNKPKKEYYSERYYVLKSDKAIKHGSYKKFNSQGVLMIDGHYSMGIQDSVWTEYDWVGKLEAKGAYQGEKKIGIWEYYNFKSELEQKYDHTKKELIYYNPIERDRDSFLVFSGEQSTMMKLDQPPTQVGGSRTILRALVKTLRYPMEAIDNEIQGTVLIAFTIDVDGTASNFYIKKATNKYLDAEALRVAKLFPQPWLPAIKDGNKVKVEYVHPIVFRLEKG